MASVTEPLLFREFRVGLPFGCGNQGIGLGGEQVPFRLNAGEQRIPGGVPLIASLAPRPPVESLINVSKPAAATFAAEQAGTFGGGLGMLAVCVALQGKCRKSVREGVRISICVKEASDLGRVDHFPRAGRVERDDRLRDRDSGRSLRPDRYRSG